MPFFLLFSVPFLRIFIFQAMVRILKSSYKSTNSLKWLDLQTIGAVSQHINIIALAMSNSTKLEGDFRALKALYTSKIEKGPYKSGLFRDF